MMAGQDGGDSGRRPIGTMQAMDFDWPGHDETNHRIANSLALLSALLSSQGRELDDPTARDALEISVHRIAAIASVHRQLYRASHRDGVDLACYLVELIGGLQDSFGHGGDHRRIHLDVDPCEVPSDFATIMGVIVTELVINACKHAYAHGQAGTIEVTLSVDDQSGFRLEVRDYGVGRAMPGVGSTGLGSRIVELMARRLGAEGGYGARDPGTSFLIEGSLPPL